MGNHKRSINFTLLALVGLNLISKLALLNWNEAEYTDSVFYLSIDQIGKTKWMPVYPFLVQFTHLFFSDLTLSGRLTSIIISTLSIFPLYAITKRLYNQKTALYTIALYIVSPVITRWSIRIMTESSFVLFLLLSIWCMIKWLDNKKTIYGIGTIFLSGLAALTRPEGLGLFPIAFAFAIYAFYKEKFRSLYWIILGMIPWFFQIVWHWKIVGKYGYGDELYGGAKRVTLSKFLQYMYLYPAYLPYIITPIVFFFAIYGIYRSIRDKNGDIARKVYHIFALYMVVSWILSLCVHWAWTTRFMFPIVALFLIFSGYGIYSIKNKNLKISAFIICIITSIAFTVIVLISSRATFGDIRASSYYIRDNLPSDAKIISSEITKVKFWSGRNIGRYERKSLKPGIYVALQNLYCDYELEMEYLKENYDLDILYHKEGKIIPLLADDMYLKQVKRKDGTIGLNGASNYPISLRTQFGKQYFKSSVILIK